MDLVSISRFRLAWLERESVRWRDAGLIDEQTRARILEAYDGEPLMRGTLLLAGLAVLMFAVGVLLLIGYNWHRIPAAGKVGIVLTAVAGSFIGSAIAYAKRQFTAGEGLAVLGTLLYGNGIWLIAQVLHIQGHFPDAFFWFCIGTAVTAFLLRSALIGVEAALALPAWAFAAGSASARPEYLFLVVWPAMVLLAYRLHSPVTLAITAFAAPLWVFATAVQLSPRPVFIGAAGMTACALYAVGDWHGEGSRMKPAWQTAALVPLLLLFIPLLVTDVHRESSQPGTYVPAPILATAIVAALLAATLLRRRPRDSATVTVAGAALALLVWTALLGRDFVRGGDLFAIVATIGFSLLALLLSVSFIRTALCTNDPRQFGFGVLLAVVFLVVRWTSVIHNMFLSGLILIAAGSGLLFIARLWRHRDRTVALPGRAS